MSSHHALKLSHSPRLLLSTLRAVKSCRLRHFKAYLRSVQRTPSASRHAQPSHPPFPVTSKFFVAAILSSHACTQTSFLQCLATSPHHRSNAALRLFVLPSSRNPHHATLLHLCNVALARPRVLANITSATEVQKRWFTKKIRSRKWLNVWLDGKKT